MLVTARLLRNVTSRARPYTLAATPELAAGDNINVDLFAFEGKRPGHGAVLTLAKAPVNSLDGSPLPRAQSVRQPEHTSVAVNIQLTLILLSRPCSDVL